VLTLSPEGLSLEDMGSKNGTLVKGVRIQRTRLLAGDEVRIGPVTLRLEEMEADDATIAIRLDADGSSVAGLPDGETTETGVGERRHLSLALLEELVAQACDWPDAAGLVALMCRALPAESACLFELREGEPVALAACGAVPDLAAHPGFRELIGGAPAPDETARVVPMDGQPPLLCALAGDDGGGPLGLVVAGEMRLGHSHAEGLLRIALVLLQRLRLRTRPVARSRPPEAPGLVLPDGYVPGESPAMRSFYAQMRPLAGGELPVLILGETGVGKEFLARILHDSSPRRGGPFVAINCAAIPDELLEAELFGIGKGVATGVAERRGRFQQAERGTLFLDEIGDMPLELQAKLLRALQEKEVQPVGASPVPVDIRVVAATNSDLHERMQQGRFRRDLYFRLAGFTLRVPPLRERREDVPGLVEGFMRRFVGEAGGKTLHGITVKALRALIEYPWPGNVRELEHEVRRLVHLAPDGDAIDSSMIAPQIAAGAVRHDAADAAVDTLDLERNIEAMERRLILRALEQAGGNRSQAARLLGVSRNGLAIKVQRLGIEPARPDPEPAD
jgi:DNA-binding NtrC family response regulator